MVKILPTKRGWMTTAKSGVVEGVKASIIGLIGTSLLGPVLGPAVAGITYGAMAKNKTVGEVLAVIGVAEGIQNLIGGGAIHDVSASTGTQQAVL